MDTDWTTIEGAGRKRECIKQNPRYYYKRHHKKHDEETKENVGPGISKREEDNLALKIHGLYYESDNNSSDSGKSSFDEEYYKYKPQPIEINSSQVVVIRNKNIIKEQGNRNKTNHNVKHPKKKRGIPNKGRNIKSNHKKGTPRIAVNEGAFEVNKNMGKGSTSKKPIFIISDKCDSTIPTSNAGNFVDQNQSVSSSFWNNSVEEPKISETQYDSTLTKSTMFFSAQHQSNNKTTPMDSDYPRRDKKLRREMLKTPLVNSVQQHLVNYVSNEGKIYNDTHNRFSNNFNEALNHLVQHQSINKTTPMDSEYPRRDKELRTEMPKTPLVNSVQEHLVNSVPNEGKIYNDTHNRFSNNFNEALNHLVQHQSINKTTPMDAEYPRRDKILRTEMPKTPLVNSVQEHLVNSVPNEGKIYNDTHNRFSNNFNEALNHLVQHQSINKTTPMDSEYPRRDKELRTEMPKTPLVNSVQEHLVNSVPNEGKIYNDTHNRFSNNFNEALNHLVQHQSINKTTPMDAEYPRRDKILRTEKTPLVNSVQQHLVNYVPNEGKIYNDTHNRFSNNFNEALNHLVQHQSINKTTPMDSEYLRRDKEVRTEMPKTPLVNSVQQHLVNYVSNEGKIYNDTHNRFSNNFNEALNHLVQHQSINKTTPMDAEYLRIDKELRTEMPKTPLVNSVQQHLVNYVPNEGNIYNDTHNRFSNDLNEAVNHLMHIYAEPNHSKHIQVASNREQKILEDASKKQPDPKTPETQKNTFLRFGSNESSNSSSNYSETVVENSAKEKIDIARAHVNKIEVEKENYPWVAKEYTIRDVWKTPKDQEIKPATPKLESYNEIVPRNDILISNNKTIMRHPQNPQNETANNLLYALDEDEPRHSPAEFSKVYVPTARKQPGCNRTEDKNNPWVAEENSSMGMSKTRKDPQIKPGTPILESNTRIVPKNDISTSSIEAIVQQPQNPLNERSDNLSPIMRNEVSEPSIAQEDDINLLAGVRKGGLLAALSLLCCCCSKVHIG
ncbi:uncharacterized protein [Leptinotarsa decemlineata]|uniref:uncharacterized protein n=1 Tax=Leptinotarsa decemlineata TaxID=7539 RepID=UPI003D308A58